MLSLIALASLTPQSIAAQVEWRTLEVPADQAVSYGLLAARDRPQDEPRPLLIVLAPVLSGDVGLQASLAAPWLPRAAESGWLVAGVGLAEPIGATVARIEVVAEALGREFVVEGRPHLWAAGEQSLDALRLVWSAPGSFASALVIAAPPPSEVEFAAAPDGLNSSVLVLDWIRPFSDGRSELLDSWGSASERIARAGATVATEGIDDYPERWSNVPGVLPRLREPEAARWKVENEVRATLDAFHAVAAKADGATYFDLLAADAVYLGTDATERWTKDQFRAFAEPYFASGRGWTYVATERHVQVSRGGDLAWFDERLENDKYGETRGTGVLRRSGGRWRIVQYNLAFPVPNELSLDLVARIRASKAPRGK